MTTATTDVLRLGLVGCVRHASQTIHSTLVRVEETQVVASCDHLPERAERAARRFGVGGYGDLPVQTLRPATSPTTGADSSASVQDHRHCAQALVRGEQPRASLKDGYRALRVLAAADESRKDGRPVSINY